MTAAEGPVPGVTIHVASANTASATELCLRSMRETAGHPFRLVVGDSGSSDGSLDRLRDFQARGWLHLEVAPGGRSHAEWLDLWRVACPTRHALFCDSDVEFLRPGWLAELVRAAGASGAALVAAEMLPEARDFVEPVGGRRVRLASRPAPWLLLLDVVGTAPVPTSFAFCAERTDAVPEGWVAYDVGARFFRDLVALGLGWVGMPRCFRKKYRHYGGLSWASPDGGGAWRRQKRRDRSRVERRLTRLRARQEG